ncbi:MAG: amidophosphoribosyltransferase [Bacteroidota bacterium]|nr:amidophosphoribosyltransferase [Bacteroidota bacterium]
MSDSIKHECGIAMIRLLKPLEYYQYKYGSWMYGLNKLYLLMEKQHNRGQDGAGVVNIKLDLKPGKEYINLERSNDTEPIRHVFDIIRNNFQKVKGDKPDLLNDTVWVKENLPFSGELFMGHVRYGTFGKNRIQNIHPVIRSNNWKSRSLALAGNFNLTNVDELFDHLLDLGQHPSDYTDTVTILEKVGHFLDVQNQELFNKFKAEGNKKKEISPLIAEQLNIGNILSEASKNWDGGYVMGGVLGHGDAFVTRDPWGIRPAFYYYDDEVAVVASERPVIQTVFNLDIDEIKELEPGHALIVKTDGRIRLKKVREPKKKSPCSFERIYFSRGSDRDIYRERKKLGELLVPELLKAVDYDFDNTVFSFIPNTSETAFYGMVKGIETSMLNSQKKKIATLGKNVSIQELETLACLRPRIEKIAIKDVKLRTFISKDEDRDDLVGHVYDITYGTINRGKDNLVIIDDSIVRGTTLRQSILSILDRLGPKKIVVVSSAPQIRYPDCYGIDMAKLGDFVAFEATIKLLKDTGQGNIINEVYKLSKEQQHLPKEEIVNHVKKIYAPFTPKQISKKIAEILRPDNISAEVEIVYQGIDNLHIAIPNHQGDWYFTGNYPTPGGNKVVNTSFINFIEKKEGRAY